MTKSPIARLFNLLKLEKHDLRIIPVLISGYGLISIATPVSIQALVNIVTMGSVLQPLFVVSLILFLLLSLSGALYIFESYIVELIQRRIFIRTSILTAENARGIEINVYDHENPAELINRFLDISIVQKSVATLLTVGLTSLLQIIIGSLILIFYSSFFSLFIFTIIGFLFFIVRSLGYHATETAIMESKAKYKMTAWLENIAKNILAFKFYQGEQRTAVQTHAHIDQYIQARSKHFNILIWQNISTALVYAIGGTGLLALGGGLVIKGEINLGQFVAAELIIFGVLAALVRLVNKLDDFYDLLAALDKIGVLEDIPQENFGAYALDKNRLDTLKLLDIEFAYNEYIQPLKKISFELKKGESLAVLGDADTGKSTLIKIIAKLRTASAGQITINNLDLRQIDNNALRNMMGLAGKIEIADGSILENICLGRDISLQKISNTLNELGLLEEFNRFPQGTETTIGPSGSPFSTSQLQRLMIARAAVASPSIIMIDGLLDSFNQTDLDAVMSMFKQHQQDWMVIVTTRFAHIAKRFDKTLDLNNFEQKNA
jgi:putative ABC transport system ATP-binding protein